MSMDKKKVRYLNAYIPEAQKETPVRPSLKDNGRMDEIEDTLAALKDILTKNNRDNLDAMYNIDMDNLSSSLKTLLKSYDDGITQAQADIQTWANAQEAGFEAVAEWQSGANTSITRIEGKADANTASITAVSQRVTETSNALAAYKQEVTNTYATTAMLSTFESTVDGKISASESSVKTYADGKFATTQQLSTMRTQMENGFSVAIGALESYVEENYAEVSMIASVANSSGKLTAASIVAAVNDAGSSVMIDADRINLRGDVVLQARNGDDDLTTEINGNDISMFCNPDYGGSDSLSRLVYRVNTGRSDNEAAEILLKNYGSGEVDDSRFAIVIKSNDFAYDGDLYSPSIKLESDMSVSVEAYQQIYLSTDGSRTGNIAADSKIIAIRPSLSYATATGRFPTTATDSGYVFCTDGIYYDGYRILQT